MEYISAVELDELLKQNAPVDVLDVRENYEVGICKIDAIHIPMNEVVERYEEIPQDHKVVVMCRTGKRAEAVANILFTEFGFSNISVLEGGIIEWIEKIDNQLEIY